MHVLKSSGETAPDSLRIAILSPSAPPVSVGGIATAHYALYRGLQSRGFSVELLTFADFGSTRFHRDEDPKIFRFGSSIFAAKAIQLCFRLWFWMREGTFQRRIYQTGDVWKSRAGVRGMRRHLDRTKPDIVIFPDQASPAAWLLKSPGQRWIQISHHHALRFVGQPEIGEHSLLDALAAVELERRQIALSDLCVAPSMYMAGVVRSFVSRRLPIEVVSNLVDGIPTSATRPDSETLRIFIPSGGSRFKGSEVAPTLIAAIRRNLGKEGDHAEFFLSGTLSAEQRARIEYVAPGARVVAPGHLSHAQVLAELAQSRVCVSPTWIENQSMALLEAKALGIPFATFDVGGNRELLGEADRVVPRGDVEALALAAQEVLARPTNPPAWNYAGQNAIALDRWTELLRGFSDERFDLRGEALVAQSP